MKIIEAFMEYAKGDCSYMIPAMNVTRQYQSIKEELDNAALSVL